MNIEAHKKAKPRQTGKAVKPSYDMKRERELAAVEAVHLRNKRDAAANAGAAGRRPPSRIAAE